MISCDDICQRTVIDAAGSALGEVEAVMLDPALWRIEALRVRLRREMAEQVGTKAHLFGKTTILVPTAAIQSVGDAVLLHVRAEQLRDTAHVDVVESSTTHAR
jgi:sporulation protein YlmC with PRC-barrel domain